MQKLSQLPQPLQFATGVTLLGLKIRRSKYDANMSWSEIRSFTKKIADPNQYLQTEFLKLLEKASKIYGNKKKYWQDEN